MIITKMIHRLHIGGWLPILIALVGIVCLSTCGKGEEEAFRQLANATSVEEIDAYLEAYKDIPMAHRDSAKMYRLRLYNDSLTYKNICQTTDVVERYELALAYTKDYPRGVHIKEVKAMAAKDKKAAQQKTKQAQILADSLRNVFQAEAAQRAKEEQHEYANRKYARLRKLFTTFYYVKDGDTVDAEVIMLTPPNDNGEGQGVIANILEQVPFTYTVYNDKELHFLYRSGKKAILTVFDDDVYLQENGSGSFYERILQ